MKRLSITAFSCAMLLLTGCRLPIQPFPGPGREGMLYCYTIDYDDRHMPFCLLGKSLTASKGNGSWEMLPPPTAIFPGWPLLLAEKYVVCPVVDTAMIPYDLWMKYWNERVCAQDGVWIKIVDRKGRPMPDVEINLIVDALYGRRIVYDGSVQGKGWYGNCIKTDKEGKAYVPIKLSSCREVRFEGWALTSKGVETFAGSWREESSSNVRIDGAGSRYISWKWGGAKVPEDWERFRNWGSRCPHCHTKLEIQGGIDTWTMEGKCRSCGKMQTERMMSYNENEIRHGVTWPTTKAQYEALSAVTGVPFSRIEEICGKCPDEDVSNLVLMRFKGERIDSRRKDAAIVYAEGTSPSEYLRSLNRTIGDEVEYELCTAECPKKIDGFDSYWDGAVKTMRESRRGEPSVEEDAGLSTPTTKVSRVVFDVGSRCVSGILFEPRDRTNLGEPVMVFGERGPDRNVEAFPVPADRALLYLSVFKPGYDYYRGEYDLKEKYRLSQYAQCEAYSLEGIEKGCESYFFYPVLSGAIWASEWLADREGAVSGVRCVGADQGAALALMTAALGGNVSEVVVSNPGFVGVMDWPGTWPAFHWHNRSGLMEEARRWMPYFELTSFAGRVKCPVTMIFNPGTLSYQGSGFWKRRSSTTTLFEALGEGVDRKLVIDASFEFGKDMGRLLQNRITQYHPNLVYYRLFQRFAGLSMMTSDE